jgi:hypothetical protein
MQQDVHGSIISIVVNAAATPAAPTAGTVTQPTCSTATGGFQITGYCINTYTFTPSVVKYLVQVSNRQCRNVYFYTN